jgi:hypothetical protein
MLSSKRPLLPSALAFATLLCPSLARAQDATSQQPNQTSTNQVVRGWRLKYFCRPEAWCPVESPSFDEIEQRLRQLSPIPYPVNRGDGSAGASSTPSESTG